MLFFYKIVYYTLKVVLCIYYQTRLYRSIHCQGICFILYFEDIILSISMIFLSKSYESCHERLRKVSSALYLAIPRLISDI